MPTISLMTDFGIKDGNVGVMKGVIWGICPSAQISDLSHMIAPQNIREAALILARSAPYFPPGSVHVIVVDPGVGTARRPIAARIGEQFFVCPDNGILTALLEKAETENQPVEIVHLTRPEYWLKKISHVFHGRDIFAPVAAHLASGIPLAQVGDPATDPVKLAIPRPEQTARGWKGEIIHIDHFGNLATNIREEHLREIRPERAIVTIGTARIEGMINTFGERPVGELVALLGSTGNLIISVVNGSAAARLEAKVGMEVEVSAS
jgi:S-adenosyl-L-methionine hydrolase (adenosine-forming)